MKQDWEREKLGQVLSIQNGYAFQSKQYSESGYFVMRIGNVQDGFIELSNPKYIKLNEKSLERFVLHNNDILVSLTGNVGRVGMIEENHLPAVLNQRVARISVIEEKKLLKSYLLYFLKSAYFIKELIKAGHGAAQQNISTKDIENLEIPIPPVFEQKEIVAILDKAFADITKAKNNAEQNLKNAKELFDSYLQDVFSNSGDGWEEKTLNKVCTKITDGTHQTPTYFSDGIIFLSSRNVTSGKINWEKIKYIDEKQHLEMHKRVAPRIGDILLAKNGTTGVAAMVDRDVVFDIYVSLALIRVLDTVSPSFMLYFINSPVAKKQFNKRLKGMGVPNLHLEEIREVIISYPKSLKEQNRVVKKLDSLSAETKRLENIYQNKIDDLEELKKSILQKAFNGEL